MKKKNWMLHIEQKREKEKKNNLNYTDAFVFFLFIEG